MQSAGCRSWTVRKNDYIIKEGVGSYQLHNRVENLANVLTICSGLLQGEDYIIGVHVVEIALNLKDKPTKYNCTLAGCCYAKHRIILCLL